MKLTQELKKRIRALEEEQSRQETELIDLDKLRDLAAISELEQELSNIDETAQRLGNKEPEIKDIELNLEHLELNMPIIPQKHEEEPQNAWLLDDDDLLNEVKEKHSVREGYVVCLMFNPKSPTEWSNDGGGGWRGKGLGSSFPDRARANAQLKALKDKWPDYPIEIKPVNY